MRRRCYLALNLFLLLVLLLPLTPCAVPDTIEPGSGRRRPLPPPPPPLLPLPPPLQPPRRPASSSPPSSSASSASVAAAALLGGMRSFGSQVWERIEAKLLEGHDLVHYGLSERENAVFVCAQRAGHNSNEFMPGAAPEQRWAMAWRLCEENPHRDPVVYMRETTRAAAAKKSKDGKKTKKKTKRKKKADEEQPPHHQHHAMVVGVDPVSPPPLPLPLPRSAHSLDRHLPGAAEAAEVAEAAWKGTKQTAAMLEAARARSAREAQMLRAWVGRRSRWLRLTQQLEEQEVEGVGLGVGVP
ncbi:MAG: hypothetical protein M1826_007657 [Phylliscum demangeonii]|nr:MAG: hypothetical protein M1826_007657 [Phylliscum demangeonii]